MSQQMKDKKQKFNEKVLDHIIREMVNVVENSKDEIFHISEEARKEYELLKEELKQTKQKVLAYIEKGDQLDQKVRRSRKKLSEVSKHFNRYSENDIRKVYEETHALQTQLAMLRQEEKGLRDKRDELERRLIRLDKTIERAEGLARKISVVLTYLHDDFSQVNEMIEEAKEKQEFGLKIIEAQEEERRKISREIHDGPAQMLANILLRSELIDLAFREGSVENALKEIQSVRETIRMSLYEVRRIIFDLRPMVLDDLGLIPTLKKYVSTISEYHDIKIEFIPVSKEKRLHPKFEVAFFRLVQESVQNAIKHAKATLITVKLELGKSRLSLIVKDNGQGFDPDEFKDKSFGLIGMRERVEMLDGKMKIESDMGRGTSIFITVPTNSI